MSNQRPQTSRSTQLMLVLMLPLFGEAPAAPLATHATSIPLLQPATGRTRMSAYLSQRKVFSVSFASATPEEAIEFLRTTFNDPDAHEFDTVDSSTWFNLVLWLPNDPSEASVTLDLKDIPAIEALRYITELSGLEYSIESRAIVVKRSIIGCPDMPTTRYKVTSRFATEPARVKDPTAALLAQGVALPKGATITYQAKTSELEVKTDERQFAAIEHWLVKLAVWTPPPPPPTPKAAVRADKLMLHRVSFAGASLTEALDAIRTSAKQADPAERGIDIVFNPGHHADTSSITLDLKNVSMLDAVRYTALLAGCTLEADDHALIIHPTQ